MAFRPPSATQTLTASGSITKWGSLVLVDSAVPVTVTLPQALASKLDQPISIEAVGLGAVTVAPFAGDTLSGQSVLTQGTTITYDVSAATAVRAVSDLDVPVAAADFWRSGRAGDVAAATLPDGTTDSTEAIEHQGGLAVGSGLTTTTSVGAVAGSLAPGILNTMSPNEMPAIAVVTPEPAHRLVRLGRGGSHFNATADFRIGRYAATGNAVTHFDLMLGLGNSQAPDAVVQTWLANGNSGLGTTDPKATLHVVGSVNYGALDFATTVATGVVGTVANIDGFSTFTINQLAAGSVLTLASPTDTTAGRQVVVVNRGTASFTMHGETVAAGKATKLVWTGFAWAPFSAASGGSAAPTVTAVAGSYTILAADAGNILNCTSATAVNFTLSGLTSGQSVKIRQGAAGQITFVNGTLTQRHVFNMTKSAGLYSMIEVTVIGTDANLSGNLAA